MGTDCFWTKKNDDLTAISAENKNNDESLYQIMLFYGWYFSTSSVYKASNGNRRNTFLAKFVEVRQ